MSRSGDAANRSDLYHGDAPHGLQASPNGSVHMCVTSPPFYGLQGLQGSMGRWLGGRPADWVEICRWSVFREVRRVLRATRPKRSLGFEVWRPALPKGEPVTRSAPVAEPGTTGEAQPRRQLARTKSPPKEKPAEVGWSGSRNCRTRELTRLPSLRALSNTRSATGSHEQQNRMLALTSATARKGW